MGKRSFVVLAVVLAVVSSYALSDFCVRAEVSSLVGAVDSCGACAAGATPNSQGECLHLGETDECSTITCILNTHPMPICPKQPSGGTPCETDWGTFGGKQQVFHQACGNGTNGGVPYKGPNDPLDWQIMQAAAECTPEVKRKRKCLHDCGGGASFADHPREGVKCK